MPKIIIGDAYIKKENIFLKYTEDGVNRAWILMSYQDWRRMSERMAAFAKWFNKNQKKNPLLMKVLQSRHVRDEARQKHIDAIRVKDISDTTRAEKKELERERVQTEKEFYANFNKFAGDIAKKYKDFI